QQHECADEKNGRVNQVRPKLIDPPRSDGRNREHECNGEAALPIGYRKHRSEQDQRKQRRQNEMAAFEFFNERRSDQESGEHNEKLHGGEATESESSHYLLRRLSPMRGVLHSVSHELFAAKPGCPVTATGTPRQKFWSHVSWVVSALKCARLDLKCSRRWAAHRSPQSFATFPQTPLHRRVLIHLGVLKIFPGELLVGAELLIGLVLFRSTDVCLIVSRIRENVIFFLALFDHGHRPGGKILELLLLGGRFWSDDF